MLRKQTNYRTIQSNLMIWAICAILLLSLSHNCNAQIYLDNNKTFKTEEDWSRAIDSLLLKGIIDSTMDAWALLRIKVDESGRVISAHIVRSANIDPSLFYGICATIEDCYSTTFLKGEIKKYQDHLVNGFLYVSNLRRISKSCVSGIGTCTNSSRKD